MMRMQKNDVINEVCMSLKVEHSKVEVIVNEFLATICRSLQKEEKVILHEFDVFRKDIEPQKIGRNPLTGNEIIIPPRAVVSFAPSQQFKEIINVND
jgi:nucleoid DNA-binding protein